MKRLMKSRRLWPIWLLLFAAVVIGVGVYEPLVPVQTAVNAGMQPFGPNRSYVLLVAASDAPDLVKADADFICDGTLDEVQINAALVQANGSAAGGGEVVLSEGTFSIDDAILIPSFTTLSGSGWKTQLSFIAHTATDSSHPVISNTDRAGGNSSITLRNLFIDGNKGTASGGAGTDPSDDGQDGWDTTAFPDPDGQSNRGCVDFRLVDNLRVEGCRIDDAWAAGIETQRCNDCWIVNNRIHRSADDGIGVNFISNNVVIANNIITQPAVNRDFGGPNGIEIQDGSFDITITGNVIDDVTDANADNAIQVASHASQDPCFGVTIIGNVMTDINRGITITSNATQTSFTNTIAITGNSITAGVASAVCISLSDCRDISITGNLLDTFGAPSNGIFTVAGRDVNDVCVSGNMFSNSVVANANVGMQLNGTLARWQVTGNVFNVTGNGVDCTTNTDLTNFAFHNNTINDATNGFFIRTDGSSYSNCSIVGNTFVGATDAIRPFNVSNIDVPFGWTVKDNVGTLAIHDREYVTRKNTSGGQLVAGDLVTEKVTGSGLGIIECTTTATAGDSRVLGVVGETIENNASGLIQVGGKVTTLKVDGTDDIAIDDALSAFTTAKIGQKVASGEVIFAIAMEAYTTDDSAGVIDAWLISPRQME